MKDDPVYVDSILQIGDGPFFLFYLSPSQLHCYKEYRRINKRDLSIAIDATRDAMEESFVNFWMKKMKKKQTIFLYQIVINFNSSSQSIYQMLSEIHDTDIIYLWLTRWLRLNVNKPKEIVCDGARALLNATYLLRI